MRHLTTANSRLPHRRGAFIVCAAILLLGGPFSPAAHADFATQSLSTSDNTHSRFSSGMGLFGRSQPLPNVVRITVEDADAVARGSGTLIGSTDEHGFVITNWHVVRDATGSVFVDFPDGFRSGATILKTDELWDLALLLIWKPNVAPMPLAPSVPQPGEPLTIAGYGQGPFRAQSGRFTDFAAPSQTDPFDMIEISASARQGDSGGPMVNQRGELAGVLFGSGGGRTTGTHVARVKMFLDSAFQPQLPPDASPLNANPDHTQLAESLSPRRQLANNLQLPATLPSHTSFQERPTGRAPSDDFSEPNSVSVTGVQPVFPTEEERLAQLNAETLAALENIPMLESNAWQQPYVNQFSASRGQPLNQLKPFFAIVGFFAITFLFLPR